MCDERLVKAGLVVPDGPNTILQVWDERLVKTELGAATLRLSDVLEQRRFKDRLRMGDAGELDIEARWLAIMAQNRSS